MYWVLQCCDIHSIITAIINYLVGARKGPRNCFFFFATFEVNGVSIKILVLILNRCKPIFVIFRAFKGLPCVVAYRHLHSETVLI